MIQQLVPDCPLCNGKRHFRTPTGGRRCECVQRIYSAGFVKPCIRGTDTTYPERYRTMAPLPLANIVSLGERSYDDFRFHVWRSLEHYSEREPTYDWLEVSRVNEIWFNNDEEYTSLTPLAEFDLLILIFGDYFGMNKHFSNIIGQLLSQRRRTAHPTWVFSELNASRFRGVYTLDTLEAVQGRVATSVVTSVVTSTPAQIESGGGVPFAPAPVLIIPSWTRPAQPNRDKR